MFDYHCFFVSKTNILATVGPIEAQIGMPPIPTRGPLNTV